MRKDVPLIDEADLEFREKAEEGGLLREEAAGEPEGGGDGSEAACHAERLQPVVESRREPLDLIDHHVFPCPEGVNGDSLEGLVGQGTVAFKDLPGPADEKVVVPCGEVPHEEALPCLPPAVDEGPGAGAFPAPDLTIPD